MKNLDNLLTSRLTRVTPRKRKYKETPEHRRSKKLRAIIRLIKTGDFNPALKSHQISLSLAIREGYISDRKTLTILKEDVV